MIKFLLEDFADNIILGSVGGTKLPTYFIFKGKCYKKRAINKEAQLGYLRSFPDMDEIGAYQPRNNPTDPTPLNDLHETDVHRRAA